MELNTPSNFQRIKNLGRIPAERVLYTKTSNYYKLFNKKISNKFLIFISGGIFFNVLN